jgi:hypothetical protein
VPVTLAGTDPENGTITFAQTGGPYHGSVTGALPALTYTPAADYIGPDTIIFTVTDDAGVVSAPAKVSITVTAFNNPPVAIAQTFHVATVQVLDVVLGGTDPDGDPLTFSQLTSSYGNDIHLTQVESAVHFEINSTMGSEFHFSFRVYDGNLYSAPKNITIIVDVP